MSGLVFTVAAPDASKAYRTASTLQNAAGADTLTAPTTGPASFGDALTRAVDGAIGAGRAADTASIAAIGGHGSLTDVVAAVSKAELALQTTASIRDRMVQAYQDIMRMPI